MLTKNDFPRWVFRSGETKLAESLADYDQAMQNGWFGTVGESTENKAISSEVPLSSPEAHEVDAGEAPPTREELEAKAGELGIEFSPKIGDKRLAERIEEALKSKES